MTERPGALNLTHGDLAVSEADGVDGLVFTLETLSDRGFERLSVPVPAEQIATLAPLLTAWLTHHPTGGTE